MYQLNKFFDGRKTYMTGLAMVVLGALGLAGVIDTTGAAGAPPILTDPIGLIAGGLAIVFLRRGIAKGTGA